MTLGAVILAGGASSRMGRDKAVLLWRGRRAIDHVSAIARELGASEIVCVSGLDYGLPRVAEDPPSGGPAAGTLAGIAALRRAGCTRALILAVDAPTLMAEDLQPLLGCDGPGAVFEGLNLPILLDVAAAPLGSGQGWPLSRLITAAGLSRIACSESARLRLRGANTPEERDALVSGRPSSNDQTKS